MWETWTGTEYEPTASRNHIMVSNTDHSKASCSVAICH
jgi:hypothetical protein